MKPTEETDALLRALRQLDVLDLGTLFGSGIDVTVHSYTPGRPDHMERVTVHPEHFGPVRDALRDALRLTIALRKESLLMQLRDIESIKAKE